MSDTRGRTRNWCFTAYQQPEFKERKDGNKIKYLIYQEEICPSTGKHHWQGYLETKEKTSMQQIKDLFNDNSLHLEFRHGTQQQAIDYCKKKDTSVPHSQVEMGIASRQGDRSDLQGLLDEIEAGQSIRQILRSHGGHALRYISHIEKAQKAIHNRSQLDNWLEGQQIIKSDSYAQMSEAEKETIRTDILYYKPAFT